MQGSARLGFPTVLVLAGVPVGTGVGMPCVGQSGSTQPAWMPGSCFHTPSHCPQEGRPTVPAPAYGGPISVSCHSPDRCPQNVPAREAAEGPSRSGSGALQARRAEPTPQAPCAPRPKPKTVSELLREKRLREARARRAAQGPVVLRPHLLVTSPVILQPPLLPASPGALAAGLAGSRPALPGVGAPAATSTSAPGSWASANKRPPILQALAIAPAPTLGPGQVPGSCHPRSLGHSQAPATCRKQGLPEAPPFLPAAPSPTPLPVQPLGPMLAPATPSSGLHTASSTPLPVTWLLTAQGGLLVTVSPSLTETQTGQGLANTDMEPGPPCRTDLTTLSTPPPAHTPAEVARAPEGPSSPGEAHVARETAPQADRPEAGPSQQPPHNGAGPGGTPASPSEPREPRVPLDIERQPPPQLGPEKGALDLGLLSQESETAVRAWLQGPRGVCVPSLRSPLPYQPPALGSLRVLSCLLLRKQALERRAAALEPLPGQLQRSPAYLLLKARFVAAFTLPALLATLPPQGVLTTLSAARASPESEDSDLGDQERSDGHRQPVEVGGRARSPCPSGCPCLAVGGGQGRGRGREQVEVVARSPAGEEEAVSPPQPSGVWTGRVHGAAAASPPLSAGVGVSGRDLLTLGASRGDTLGRP